MAVFEKRTCGRVNLDDTQPLTCSILGAQNVQGHMEFLLQVARSIALDNKWTISRRYSDFLTLKNYFLVTAVDLPLPPKKIFGNMEREFVAERQQGLQDFVNIILSHPVLSQNINVKRFFDPENYVENYNELGLQFVSMFLRSEPQWTLVEPLFDLDAISEQKGQEDISKNKVSRLNVNKTKFITYITKRKLKLQGTIKFEDNYIQQVDEFKCLGAALGPDCYLDDKDLQSYMKSLSTLLLIEITNIFLSKYFLEMLGISVVIDTIPLTPNRHPCICPVKFSSAMDSGGIVIREYFSNVGSVKDCLQMTKPGNFLRKYGKSKTFTRTPVEIIKRCGRQILDALQFLHEKGIACGNLHTGNLVIQNDICQILDVESYVLGLPSFYRPFIVQIRKIQTIEAIDVYSFGHVLYEMTFGIPLLSSTCDTFPENCPDDLRDILESILTPDACKNGMPTINNLLLHQ
ncbi:PX domain-containing protein kinase-like protein [Nymphon striatum]|nr:PX domain-containing protein kinase-like protein [Nymphon striatum]